MLSGTLPLVPEKTVSVLISHSLAMLVILFPPLLTIVIAPVLLPVNLFLQKPEKNKQKPRTHEASGAFQSADVNI
jgi:hypothetical protein